MARRYDNGCPTCGSYRRRRIGGTLLTNGADRKMSGTYRCEYCDQVYTMEVDLPEFSPTAKCPHCDSFDTIIVKKHRLLSQPMRYHVCRGCNLGFKTKQPAG